MTLKNADDIADMGLLGLANEKGKFAIQISCPLNPQEQFAFERGIDNEWFTFVDVSKLAEFPFGGLFKCFRLTERGKARLAWLRASLPTPPLPNAPH